MKSRFQLFFIVSKVLLSMTILVFAALPVLTFIDTKGGHREDGIIPAIVAAVFVFPLVFIFIRGFDIITITLDDEAITIKSWRNKISLYHRYSDIIGIKNTLYKIEGHTRGPRSNPKDINYEPVSTIYFNDGSDFTMYDDTYSNIQEMLDYIESKRSL